MKNFILLNNCLNFSCKKVKPHLTIKWSFTGEKQGFFIMQDLLHLLFHVTIFFFREVFFSLKPISLLIF